MFVGDIGTNTFYAADVVDLQFSQHIPDNMDIADMTYDAIDRKLYLIKSLGQNAIGEIYTLNTDGTDKTFFAFSDYAGMWSSY